MLSHKHLNLLATRAGWVMRDLVRHVQCGGDLTVELAYALAELDRYRLHLHQIPPEELNGQGVDWEGAGLVMSEALGLALANFAKSQDVKAATRVFSRRVSTLMRPKLYR